MKRLESLDVLRGFDMFFIFLPDPVPCIVLTFLAMFGLEHSAFAAQFDHCAWNGLHFYDCIFPLFLFISGVTFPFSYARQRERGDSTARISLKILFFKVIGMNAITIYILMRTVFNWDFESTYFFGGLAGLFPPAVGAFVTQAGMMALGWLFLYWLYRKNIFLRV